MITRAARTLLLPVALLALASTPIARAQTEPQLLPALITRVIDGDTLDAQVQGMRTPVGYLGVTVPALNQPCGAEAFARNRELVSDGVLLEPVDPTVATDDRHRMLFYAYTADGTSIDETLIREGLAHAAHTDAPHGADLAALEADASASARGCLWSAGASASEAS